MRMAVNGRFLAVRPTGVQRVARRLVLALAERTDLTLLLPRGCESPADIRAATVPGRLSGVLWEQLELPARTRTGYDVCLHAANAGPLWGGRRVLILHDVFPLTHPEWYTRSFRAWFRTVVARAARGADRIIMFSEWAKRQASTAIGVPGQRVTVVTQGTGPFDGPASHDLIEDTLSRFGLAPGFLLATGAGDARKNLGFLHDVMQRLASGGGETPTLVVTGAPYGHVQSRAPEAPGTGPAAGTGTAVTSDGPGGGGVTAPAARSLGYVTDAELHALYSAAGVFCSPSLAEGFGRSPLEAMACGTPVIAAKYGSAREVLGDGARILPLDAPEWARAIRQIRTDPDVAAGLRAAGRARARSYRWDLAAEQVLTACREVVATNVRTSPSSRARPGGR